MNDLISNRVSRSIALVLALAVRSALAAEQAKPREVQVVHANHGDVTRFVSLPGTIRANQQAALYATVAGYLNSFTVDKGDAVSAGQVLAEIEVPELLADRARFRAEVKVAEADSHRVLAAQAKAPDLITAQSVDDAQARADIARANLERTETLLGFARLTAPFPGVVTARYLDPGAFVPAATAGGAVPAAVVLAVADFSTVRVQVPVPEADASYVVTGQLVRFTTEGHPGRVFEGRVSRYNYILDDTAKTMLVEADMPNPGLVLRPGMYASARIGVETHTNVLTMPMAALVMEKQNAFAFVATGGVARKTPVKIGFNDESKVEILNGLTGDPLVILGGRQPLTDGAAIAVTEAK